MLRLNAVDGLAELLRLLAGGLEPAAGQQNAELLPAEASENVAAAQVVLADRHGALEDEIPGGMPEPVVDRLEMIQVEEHQRDFLPRPFPIRQRSLGALYEMQPVG